MRLVRNVMSWTAVLALSAVVVASPAAAQSRSPATELRTDLILFGPLLAGEPAEATMWTWNSGDGAAATWSPPSKLPRLGVLAPSGSEPGRSCSVALDVTSVTCNYESIEPGTRRDIALLLTPPTGSGTGTVTVEAQTPTPENGTFPNTDAKTVRYAPAGARHRGGLGRSRSRHAAGSNARAQHDHVEVPQRDTRAVERRHRLLGPGARGRRSDVHGDAPFEAGGSSGSNCDVDEGDQEPSLPARIRGRSVTSR